MDFECVWPQNEEICLCISDSIMIWGKDFTRVMHNLTKCRSEVKMLLNRWLEPAGKCCSFQQVGNLKEEHLGWCLPGRHGEHEGSPGGPAGECEWNEAAVFYVAPSILWESYCPVHGFCSQVYHALVLIQQQKQLKEGAKTMKGKFGSQFGGTAHGEGEVMIAGVQGSWLPCVCR